MVSSSPPRRPAACSSRKQPITRRITTAKTEDPLSAGFRRRRGEPGAVPSDKCSAGSGSRSQTSTLAGRCQSASNSRGHVIPIRPWAPAHCCIAQIFFRTSRTSSWSTMSLTPTRTSQPDIQDHSRAYAPSRWRCSARSRFGLSEEMRLCLAGRRLSSAFIAPRFRSS